MPDRRNGQNIPDLRMASSHLQERREVRYPISIEIEVSGIDQDGQAFHERTVTKNVSEWGCSFLLSIELKPDDIVALRVALPKKESAQSLFQVLRVTREEARWSVAAWKVDGASAWGVDLEKVAKAAEGTRESREEETPGRVQRTRRDVDR
jgi:hypothetical protein